MTKESTKCKTSHRKSNAIPNTEFETCFKNQQMVVSKLKSELKSMLSKVQLSECGTTEKDKIKAELEQSIHHRDAEIDKLKTNMDELKEENKQILLEFNCFKEKFYQLETDYDASLGLQKQENDNLLRKLKQQETKEKEELQELSLQCQDLQQKLQVRVNDLTQLNNQHLQTLQNFDNIKKDFEQLQNDFELYKKQVQEEKIREDAKIKFDFEQLKTELKEKDQVLMECISNKNALEKEKNLIIDELKNKIHRIERAFSQPTKGVQPILQASNKSEDDNNSENSNGYTSSNNEIKKPDNIQIQRPIQLTSSQQKNGGTNRKRRNQPARQTSALVKYNEFSLSSGDEDEDESFNYDNFSKQLWRPNTHCYVTDTDASEGFAKPKRPKK